MKSGKYFKLVLAISCFNLPMAPAQSFSLSRAEGGVSGGGGGGELCVSLGTYNFLPAKISPEYRNSWVLGTNTFCFDYDTLERIVDRYGPANDQSLPEVVYKAVIR